MKPIATPTASAKLPGMPSEDEWADAEMTAEEALGKPFPHTAEQGMAAMQQRIRALIQRIAELDQQEPRMTDKEFNDLQAELNAELTEARQRLAEYRQQHEGRN